MGQAQQDHIWNLIAKKLAGEATAGELQELERLLRDNPELHYPMQTIADLWRSAGTEDRAAAEQAFSKHLDRIKDLQIDYDEQPEAAVPMHRDGYSFPRNRSKSTQRRLLIGSLVAGLSGLGILFAVHMGLFSQGLSQVRLAGGPTGKNQVSSEVFTRSGSKTHLVLSDGTVIWLNADSRITYDKDFGLSSREVNLIGEAYFDVARNPDKPFQIHTARLDIKVLGTSFDVKSYPTDKTTETTLIRGSLEVSIKDRPNEKIILKPDEKLVVVNDDSSLHRPHIAPGVKAPATDEPLVAIRKPGHESSTGDVVETSWIDNKLIFQDETFDELAVRMERWYGVKIRFTDPDAEEWHFTGTFRNESIQQALDALRLTADFNYHIEGDEITIFGK